MSNSNTVIYESDFNDCECFRFPAGNLSKNASERIKEKADVQIRKNNVLLNCNNKLMKTDYKRRVYSGIQNRLRSINGYKTIEKKKADAGCNGNTNCVLNDKNAPDYWIIQNSNLEEEEPIEEPLI